MSDSAAQVTALYQHQSDNLWIGQVVQQPELFYSGRTLLNVQNSLRRLVDEHLGTAVEIVHEYDLPEDTKALIAETLQARHDAEIAQVNALEKLRRAAEALTEDGFSTRDAGVVLDLSHTRVQQLVSDSTHSRADVGLS